MPSDVMRQTCKRVFAVAVLAVGLWSLALIMNNVVASLLGHPAMMDEIWPFPGNLICSIGIAISLLLVYLAWRLSSRPQLLIDISSGFLVVTCLLGAILTQWVPPSVTPRISWLSIIILSYPAIVPATPKRTLWISLLAASTEPLALGLTHLRGVAFQHTAFYYIWDFLPTYVSAFIAVVPAKIIRGLGHQVRQARELGSYRLGELLGKGGMGEVYRASHQLLARPAAVKLINAEVLGGSSAGEARVITERFRREAEAAALLRSPHTINLYDFGVAQDGTFFFVMELLDGLSLESLVERFGPVPPERAVHLLQQACHSLEEAHARGLVHRDIKPSNIFTCRMGLEVDYVKVLDFGLVKSTNRGEQPDTLLTAPDSTTGTPAYIAPEIVRGDAAVDHRVDIYALGCVAYWLVTGRLVFQAPNAIQMMYQHAHAEPKPPSSQSELEIPPAFDETVLACLAKRPDARPQTAAELSRRLAQAVAGEGWSGERAARWWDHHRPELTRQEATAQDGPMLTKTVEWAELEGKGSAVPEEVRQ